jgi:tetratricopeptide (TPR) repeat protein
MRVPGFVLPPLLVWLTGACPTAERGPARIEASHLPGDLPALLRVADEIAQPFESIDVARRALAAARRALELEPDHPGASWRAARACFVLADAASTDEERRRWADEGAKHAGRAAARQPRSAEAHYYLAVNLGLVASTRPVGALQMVPTIAAAGKRAMELAPSYDRGGPLRLMGRLYAKAPPWPTSIGDLEEAMQILRRAVDSFPDEPLNRLFLAEALVSAHRYDEAKAELRRVLAAAPKGDWARVGKRWRREARKLLRRAELGKHQQDQDE